MESPESGFIQMTEEGKRIIDDKIEITITYLKNNYPEFKEFQTPNKKIMLPMFLTKTILRKLKKSQTNYILKLTITMN